MAEKTIAPIKATARRAVKKATIEILAEKQQGNTIPTVECVDEPCVVEKKKNPFRCLRSGSFYRNGRSGRRHRVFTQSAGKRSSLRY